MIRKWYWIDGFDGGNGSKPFDTEEEAREAAVENARSIRLTARELECMTKKCENHVFIGYIDFPDDADEDEFESKSGEFVQTDGIELNKDTLDRIY